MSSATAITVFQGDNKPDIFLQLSDAYTGGYIDLTAPTRIVKANVRKKGTTTLLITAQALIKVTGGEAAGQCYFVWPAAITWAAGWYEMEIYIEDDGTNVQTMNDVLRIKVKADF